MTRFTARQGLIGLVGLGALLLSTTATAATDGTLGLTSTGTTDISIIKGDTAQITGLQDMVMTPWTAGSPAPVDSSPACVYTSTGNYQVTMTSANGAGGAYRLADGANFVNYGVQWNDGAAGFAGTTNGNTLVGRSGSTIVGCGGTTPATVQVNISIGNITAAPVGNYSDTLTVLIAPE